jgi:hypothetical protein
MLDTAIFRHGAYIATLPPPSALRTSLHFTAAELEMLRGTNLYRATLDRHAEWKDEYRRCVDTLRGAARDTSMFDNLTWCVCG